MKTFLVENWLWIVAPIVLAVLAVVLLLVLTGDPQDGGFIYNVW